VAAGSPDRYLLLLGSNVEPAANIERADGLLALRYPVLDRSRTYEGPAVGHPSDPPFLNRALLVRCALAPAALREALRDLEESLGRRRTRDRNAPRTIDIDVLLALDADGAVLADPPLHRDLLRHHHATLPAADVAPGLVLPGGSTLAAAAAALGPPPPGFRPLPA
jgi:2-amino-4-hydroxy-6-hydroxymethyldihydropteridine diphosphokinase